MKKIFLATIILLIFISCSGVWAEDNFTDNILSADQTTDNVIGVEENQEIEQTNNDEVIGTNPGTFKNLQEKIHNADPDSTIVLDRDYYYNEGFDTNGINIDRDLIIDGNGYTIDGLSKSRIFHCYSESHKEHYAVLKNINMVNGKTGDDGGAIYTKSNIKGGFDSTIYEWYLAIENCHFKNNEAVGAGGAICADSLTISGSSFTGNKAATSGGAIYGGAQCIDCIFTNNQAGNGGALSNRGTSLVNCIFTGNSAKTDGGAINCYYGGVNAASCTFNSNSAGDNGGAIYNHMGNSQIKNSKFNNNVASDGGGIYYVSYSYSHSSGSSTTYKNLYSQIVEDSTFTGNVANSAGGAVYSQNPAGNTHSAKMVRCTFDANKAAKGSDTYGAATENCIFKTAQSSSSSSSGIKLALKTVNVKKSAKKLILKATLKKGNTPLNAKKITFKFNGKTYKAKTNKKGIAKVTIKKNVLKKLKVGKKVKYQASYGKITVKKTAKIKK